MAARIVCHARKIKTGAGLRNVAMHNSREAVYEFACDEQNRVTGAHQVGELPAWVTNPAMAP
jgi:hypothetical protein